jgi:hypothetical protein
MITLAVELVTEWTINFASMLTLGIAIATVSFFLGKMHTKVFFMQEPKSTRSITSIERERAELVQTLKVFKEAIAIMSEASTLLKDEIKKNGKLKGD